MSSLLFLSKPPALPLPGSARENALRCPAAQRPALGGYQDAYAFHRRLCMQISQGQPVEISELLPELDGRDEEYLENFKTFVIAHTLPAIGQLLYESGRSNRERRHLLDMLLRRLRDPDKVAAEAQAQALKI